MLLAGPLQREGRDLTSVLRSESTADHNSYKGKYFIGAGLQYQRYSRFLTFIKYGSMQTDMGLEKEMSVPNLDPKAGGDWV